MKLKFKLLLLFLGLGYLSVQANEFTRDEHSAYLKSGIKALDITNKFGTITINDFGGDSVTVDVKITIDNINENKAEYLLDQIEITTQTVGSLLKVETKINDDFKTKQNFSIDYTINIPADRDLTVSNKYGNVVINKLEAKGNFNVDYGNISTDDLQAPENQSIKLDISYGKADIESVSQMQTEIKYSKLFIGESKSLNIDSKYSGLNIKELGTLVLVSKYDVVEVEKLGTLKSESKYTNYDIGELEQSLMLDTQYGSVHIDKVSPEFTNIEVTNSYGGIDIGLPDTNYYLDANCDYCDIKYPDDMFMGNREKKDHSLILKGNVGNGTSNKKVTINSRYSGIKLK